MQENSDRTSERSETTHRPTRRKVLAATGLASAGSLAGCFGLFGGNGNNGSSSDVNIADFRGSGPLVSSRGDPGGTSISELPDLEGELSFYLGGGEGGLYLDLIRLFEQVYPDFTFSHTRAPSSQLSSRIVEEVDANASQADVFIAVDAGSLGNVADAGAAASLPSSVTDSVPSQFTTGDWVGIAGRARAVPYNTTQLSASDIPDTVQAFPNTDAFQNNMGWAPSYGAFQSFITAMRLIRGKSETRQWLNDMQAAEVLEFGSEFEVSNQVANGEIVSGFANHYYALRVQSQRQDAPLDLAFTSGDAGALINVSGAQIISGTQKQDLAENFVRHLLSSEAQEFFATRTFAYPTVSGINPVGGLPSIDELNPPDIDLAELSDTGPTLDLLTETGVL
ncbi:extracellular solute-binding protein [Salinibaculum rarum]|uniref:extracellular solute-binding protein n=1 Tax=Salinibaculum rarum TaxID=3058903 RepID=UPI00265F966E|nr:extracellular solute-binding protein [Salinibaculum sp. KK48]